MPANGKSAKQLGHEIFMLVETEQGKGFLSDGIESLPTPDKVFSAVRGHLKHAENQVKILRKWLRKYDEF